MKKYCIFWVVFLVLFVIGFLKALFHMAAGHVIAQILFLGECSPLCALLLKQIACGLSAFLAKYNAK